MNSYKIKKYLIKLSEKDNDIYRHKIYYYLNNFSGGANFNYINELINKHQKMFPESVKEYKELDDMASQPGVNIEDIHERYFDLIRKYEFRILKTPKTFLLEKGSIIYHLSPNILDYPNAKANFFADDPEKLQEVFLPFKINKIRNEKGGKNKFNIYIYIYRVKEDIKLIYTSFDFNIFNLETYLISLDPTYKRSFDIKRNFNLNNYKVAHWLHDTQHKDLTKFKGWYEEVLATTNDPRESLNEIMLLGNTEQYLEKIGTKVIEIN